MYGIVYHIDDVLNRYCVNALWIMYGIVYHTDDILNAHWTMDKVLQPRY